MKGAPDESAFIHRFITENLLEQEHLPRFLQSRGLEQIEIGAGNEL
jgi:hypothetical protein